MLKEEDVVLEDAVVLEDWVEGTFSRPRNILIYYRIVCNTAHFLGMFGDYHYTCAPYIHIFLLLLLLLYNYSCANPVLAQAQVLVALALVARSDYQFVHSSPASKDKSSSVFIKTKFSTTFF